MTITTKEPTTHRCIGWVAAFTLLSWFGEFVHNRADLPLLSLLSPENTIPAMITGLLFLAWWLLPLKRTTHVAWLCWAWLNLIGGGILSVLPFPFWPYQPGPNGLPLRDARSLWTGPTPVDRDPDAAKALMIHSARERKCV